MAHRAVETLLGRLATDPDLLHRFERDPAAVVAEFQAQGHELTPVEREALVGTDAAAIAALAGALDRRIRKAGSAGPAVAASGAEPNRARPHRLTAKRRRKRRSERPVRDRVSG
jgi:hypothetical protein